jgi:GNAT superfamily N-acetyltransferase
MDGAYAPVVRRAQLTGSDALSALTALLHRARRAHPTWGVWEAADLHWWWRFDQRDDPRDCTVWLDTDSEPALAVTAVHFHDGMLADIIRLPSAPIPDEVIDVGRDLVARHRDRHIDWSCPTDDAALIDAYLAIGAEPIDERMVETWIDAGDLPPVPDCPASYELRTRADTDPASEHHMVPRTRPDVERRLRESPLYRADLDLWVSAEDGSPAGYALFWRDPETRVGLVEPMRVHDPHQRRGLARLLLIEGAQRLADSGCTRIKVSYMDDNPAAERTYVGGGFQPTATIQTYRNAAQ